MVIWPAFRMWQYRVNDHPYHTPPFISEFGPIIYLSDLEGSYFDESGVGFANQRRDWMKHLDLDKTGYSIYSAATYHLEGGLRKVHDFFTKHQASNTIVKELRSYNLS